MEQQRTFSEQITTEVAAWPGVEVDDGELGELAFKVGNRELGHLHGEHAAHFGFPKSLGLELRAAGRITDHPAFPGKVALGARRVETDDDVRDVVELMRINYDRLMARQESA
jgi:luciferase-like monooxygenase